MIDIFELLDRLKRIPIIYLAPEDQTIFKEGNILTKYYQRILIASHSQWIQGQENVDISATIENVITINNIFSVTSNSHNSAMQTLAAIRDAREEGFVLYLRDFSLGANRYFQWSNNNKTPTSKRLSISPEYGDHTIVNALRRSISKPIIGLYNDSYLKQADFIKINNRGGSALASIGALGASWERMLPFQLSVHDYRYSNMIRTQSDTWEKTVTMLAEIADAVVLYISEFSEGTRWEKALINSLKKQRHTLVLYGNDLIKGRNCPDEAQIKDEFLDYFAAYNLVDNSTYASQGSNIELSFSENLAIDLSRLSNIASIKGDLDSTKIEAILSHPFYLATRPIFFSEDKDPLTRQLLVSKDMRPLFEKYIRLREVTLSMIEGADKVEHIDRIEILHTLFFVFAMASMFEDYSQVISAAINIHELSKSYITDTLAQKLSASITSLAEGLTST